MEAANAKKMKHITTMLLNPRAAPLLVPVYANMPVRDDKSGRLFFVNLRLSDLAPSLIKLGAVPAEVTVITMQRVEASKFIHVHTHVYLQLGLIASVAPCWHIYILGHANAGPTSLRQNLQEEEAGAAAGLQQQLPQESLLLQLSFEPNSVHHVCKLRVGFALRG